MAAVTPEPPVRDGADKGVVHDNDVTPRTDIAKVGSKPFLMPQSCMDPLHAAQTDGLPHTVDAARLLLLLAFVSVPFPLSLPFMLLFLTPRQLWHLLVNIGVIYHNPADGAAPPAFVRQHRISMFLFWHVPTVLLLISLIVWAASPPGTGSEAASICNHMAWLQLLLTSVMLFPRRHALAATLSNAWVLGGRWSFTDAAQPTVRVFHMHLNAHIQPVAQNCINQHVIAQLGFRPDDLFAVMTEHGYEVMRRDGEAAGLIYFPSLASVRATAPDGLLRRQDGRVILVCRGTELPALRPDDDLHVQYADVQKHGYVACDVEGIMAHGICYVAAATTRVIKVVLATMFADVVTAFVPFMVRAALGVPTAGITAAHTVVFVCACVVEVIVSVLPSGLSGSVLLYYWYSVEAAGAEWFAYDVPSSRRASEALAVPVQPVEPVQHVEMVPGVLGDSTFCHPIDHARILQLYEAHRRDVDGLLPLDCSTAVTAAINMWQFMTGFFGGGSALFSMRSAAVAPIGSAVASLILALVFTLQPERFTQFAAPMLAFAGTTGLRQAALLPTCVVFIRFFTSGIVLLMAFRRLVDAVYHSERGMVNALGWMHKATLRRAAALASGDTATAQEQEVLLDRLRVLHNVMAQAISTSPGMRFLGVLHPGNATFGGLATFVVSIAVLGLRLASAIFSSS